MTTHTQHNTNKVDYLPKGVEHVVDILNRSNLQLGFLAYGDADIDGVVSNELVMRFLDTYGMKYQVYMNPLRQHGFKIPQEEWHQYKGMTVIFTDAGISKELLQQVVDSGINFICIDHHDISYEELVIVENTQHNTKGVIINNNYHFEPHDTRFLSGAGVVYYVLNHVFGGFGHEERALVGLTLLSDMRDLSPPLAKELLHETYSSSTEYFQYLVEATKPEQDWGFGVVTMNRNYIEYTFCPKINALMRCNHNKEVVELFRGHYPYTEKRMSAMRVLQKEVVKEIKRELEVVEYSHLYFAKLSSQFMSMHVNDITTMVGLTASDFVSKGKTTILVIETPEGEILRGSLRGLAHDVNYLKLIRQLGVRAEGHEGAFGILNFNNCDLEQFNTLIALQEEGYAERKYGNRIHETNNLSHFISTKVFQDMANYNNYVRDNERLYIKYTGSEDNIHKTTLGRKIDYLIEGVPVQCFDDTLNFENDLILPIIERGTFKSLFLRKR